MNSHFQFKNMLLLAIMLFATTIIKSQLLVHPAINSFGLRFSDNAPNTASITEDSAVVVTYVVSIKDTVNTNKIYVRISSGTDTTGNILQNSYLVHSSPITNAQNQVVFKREKDVIYILTVSTTQNTVLNYEVYTEDLNQQKSPALQWLNP
ncbi:MAG: hypothetical protein JST26_05805 [Bacteroidetes bacterium]|nr:hypothetical protein [Bacteroidota bacterium]